MLPLAEVEKHNCINAVRPAHVQQRVHKMARVSVHVHLTAFARKGHAGTCQAHETPEPLHKQVGTLHGGGLRVQKVRAQRPGLRRKLVRRRCPLPREAPRRKPQKVALEKQAVPVLVQIVPNGMGMGVIL